MKSKPKVKRKVKAKPKTKKKITVKAKAKVKTKTKKPEPTQKPTHPQGSICFTCAKETGAIAPVPMIVTCWEGQCCVCKEIKNCCSTSDYHWPDGTRAVFD